jgi:hypothetical protein
MFKARERLKTIEDEAEKMRKTLKIKIDEKMQLSQTNLEKMMIKRTSTSHSQ